MCITSCIDIVKLNHGMDVRREWPPFVKSESLSIAQRFQGLVGYSISISPVFVVRHQSIFAAVSYNWSVNGKIIQ